MLDFQKLEEIIKGNKSFLLTTHVNPDADAIGSEMAFYFILKKLGKEVYIVNHSETPYNLLFLDKTKIIQKFEPKIHNKLLNNVDIIVLLDLNKVERTGRMKPFIEQSSKTKICIDHHMEPENFTEHLFVEPNYSATGHLLYDFIFNTKIVEFDFDIAFQLYAAIMTDTGSFRFDRTTPEIHRIAAHLLELGVLPDEVFDNIYDQSRFNKILLLGEALKEIKLLSDNNEIAYSVLSRSSFEKTGALENDTDGFVNFCLSIENVKIGILFIELKEGFKVSFRSKGKIPVHLLAKEYGGGGHTNAAGVRIPGGKLENNINQILERSIFYLNEYKG